MSDRQRIYLDNAATSWPKPQSVYDAVDDYQRRLGAAVGRSGYAEAEEVAKAVDGARAAVGRLIGAESADRIIFTSNGTDSLNLAIHGLLKTGDHVITSVVEHNSVLRPLRWLEDRGQIQVTRVGCDGAGVIDPDDVRAALRRDTKLIALIHASNVTGAIQPAREVGRIARDHGVLYLLDAAQTLGYMPISAEELGTDLIAAPGHKGLLGPLGTGVLYIRRGVEEIIDTVKQGGTGSASSNDKQPTSLPHKYESGNHNAPGLIGLGAGMEYLQERSAEDLRQHAIGLTDRLLHELAEIPGVTIHGPANSSRQIGVVSVTLAGHQSPEVAATLDRDYRIQVRAGYQCAALMHQALHTVNSSGTIRFSIGTFNNDQDIAVAARALGKIAADRFVARRKPVDCPCVSTQGIVATGIVPATSSSTREKAETDTSSIPGLRELWAETLGDPRVCIAVLDGPVDVSHPSLTGADLTVVPTALSQFSNEGAATRHGTHVSSVIFGQHDSPISGIAPACRGLIVPIFRDGHNRSVTPCSQLELARAIELAVERGANVINISGGQFSPFATAHPILADAIRRCSERGALIVAAAGNQGCDCMHVPGALPSVLPVGAMNLQGQPLEFSNWGAEYRTRGVLAPGEGILGAVPKDGVIAGTGTSYATPIASGVAALLLSHQLSRDREPNTSAVRDAIVESALGCDHERVADCRRLLAGRLNVAGAVSILTAGENSMANTNVSDQAFHRQQVQSNDQTRADNAQPMAEPRNDQIAPTNGDGATVQHAAHEGPTPPNNEPAAFPPVQQNGRVATAAMPSASMGTPQAVEANRSVTPADCGCQGNQGPAQHVLALGSLNFDFGSEVRRDYFTSTYDDVLRKAELGSSTELRGMHALLSGSYFPEPEPQSWLGEQIIWTLSHDETPIYAIQPCGAFAHQAYARLNNLLGELLASPTEIPETFGFAGTLNGSARLITGQIVPVICPDIGAMWSWRIAQLVKAFTEDLPREAAKELSDRVTTVFKRTYYDFSNLGISSADRALNYSVTNGVNMVHAIEHSIKISEGTDKNFELDTITTEKSPICRPGYDCWDVKVIFFDSNAPYGSLREVVKFTVDVSDVIPVAIGDPRTWPIR